MSSLLDETIKMLEFFGKGFNDILWIGTKNGYITVDTFKKFATIEFNSSNEMTLARDLIIMGTDFIMMRGVDECWEYESMPKDSTWAYLISITNKK